ncbi:MAG: Hpt domain-containing protein, partial [Pseudomonadota bacterium]|nr:Hpt domain-containing protein [Pseudomonadota bacterium]
LTPALRRFGLARTEVDLEPEARRTGTVSPLDIDVHKQKVQALYEDWKETPGEDARAKLERAVGNLQRDAAVVADSAVAQHTEAALQVIKEGSAPDETGVFRAIQGLAPDKAPEVPAAQMVQLVDAPGAEVDRELLEIFLEEAAEVVATIVASLDASRASPHDREALTVIRRGFHTLKGSGRMVGLNELGEVAWQCEQVLNKWLKDEKPASEPLIAFIDHAQAAFARWVRELKDGASARIEAAEITQRAESLKSDAAEPLATPPVTVDERAPAGPAPFVMEPSAAQPVFELEEAEPLAEETAQRADFVAEFAAPPPAASEEAPVEPFMQSIDDPAALQPFEPEAAPESAATSAARDEPSTAEPAFEFLDAAPAAFEPPASLVAAEPDVTVGPVSLAPAFFAIYVTEAEQHVASMDEEMARIEADPMVPVSADFMRAAHTLASNSRTTGFEALADVASALEKWLADAMDLPPEFNAHRLAATRAAVGAVTAMVQSIRGRAMPYPRDDIVAQLAQLREGLRAARVTGEGTHIKMPGMGREGTEAVEVQPPASIAPMEVPQPTRSVAPVELPLAKLPEAPAPEAAPEPQFEAGKDQRKIKDDVDRDLLPVFLDEAREIIPAVAEAVRRWKLAPSDHKPAAELQRHLHTLKGSARMSGLMRLGELAHVLEERVNAIEAAAVPQPAMFEEVEERIDRFSLSLERLGRGEDILEADRIEVPVAAIFEQQKDKPAGLAVIAAAAQERAERDALPPELREARTALLRVNAEMIDRFVNEAGELSIARSRIEGEMVAFKRAMVDLTENIARMRAQLREVEMASESQMQSSLKLKEELGETFDPLELDRFSRMQELTRFLAESLGDVITLHQGLQKNIDESELAIHAQARLNRDLQQGLMSVRLVPLGNLADRFYRIVRQTAKELDKKANLELKGTRTELDRSVLEKITAPFEHLLRNAIAHGLEKPAERARAGKPEIGEISIEAAQRGNEVVLTVSDDGAGLNFPRIRQKAVESGLLAPDVELPEPQLAQFIFMSGFSTATEVSEVAGRGVGMDVVKNEITSLGGRVEISSNAGRGTTFTISLPLTLAVTQAVMLRAGTTVYAVPSVMIDQVQEYKAQPYAEIAARGEVDWKGNRYPLRSLLPLLGEIDTPTPLRQIPVLLLRSGLQHAAIRVDEIIGNREVVVKTIGPQLSRLSGIAGATVLGNGQVVLILNPVQLVHRDQPAFDASRPVQPAPESALVAEAKSGAPLVMVVDDSLTVRKITSRMLTREGFEVATAKDGVDALQQLQELKPDCILLDVEMPRMDGFEFARNLRADAGTRAIPIIMITSRTAEKHRNRALELGVNEYMGKPYQEDQLLALIRRYTAESAMA